MPTLTPSPAPNPAEPQTLPLRDAVEAILRDRAACEPGFVEKVMVDPNGVIEPIITQLIGDDGALDLTEAHINVHVQTAKAAHFVLAIDDRDEVTPYAVSLNFGQILGLPVKAGGLGRNETSDEKTSGTETTCNTSASCCPTNCKGFATMKAAW